MTVLGLILVVSCAFAGAQLATHAQRRAGYLALVRFVPEGDLVTAGDLTVAQLGPASGLALVPAGEADIVVGRRAGEPLLPGTLISPAEVTTASPLQAGVALVGTNLSSDQMPAGLEVGDSVLVVLAGQGASSSVSSPVAAVGSSGVGANSSGGVVTTATVSAMAPAPADSSGETVTIDVPRSVAAIVTAASAAGDVSLAQISGVEG